MKKEDLEVDTKSMNKAVKCALDAYKNFKDSCKRDDNLIVVDYTQPSFKKRLHVVDIKNKVVVSSHHVAHGEGSSDPHNLAYAVKFSDRNESHMSSLGAMVTDDTYFGKHGYSLRLNGLEKSNSNVRRRCIVIHSAQYVTNAYILKNERAGQSWGCPAVDPAISNALIQNNKGGVFFFAYYE